MLLIKSDRLLADTDLVLPWVPAWAEPVWHLFVVRHSQRDVLQQRLQQAGIGTMIHYPIPPHLSGAYAAEFAGRTFPLAERLAPTVLSLPMGPQLTRHDQARVTAAAEGLTSSDLTPHPHPSP